MHMIMIYFQIMYKDRHLFRATKTSVGYPLPSQNFDHISSQAVPPDCIPVDADLLLSPCKNGLCLPPFQKMVLPPSSGSAWREWDAVEVFRQIIIQKNMKRTKKISVHIFEIRCISILLHSWRWNQLLLKRRLHSPHTHGAKSKP